MEPVKCSRGCSRSRYPNEMTEIVLSDEIFFLCPDRTKELEARLRSKTFFRTHGEIQANKRAAAKATAWNFGGGW